jgi:hypothetical protein
MDFPPVRQVAGVGRGLAGVGTPRHAGFLEILIYLCGVFQIINSGDAESRYISRSKTGFDNRQNQYG